MYCNNKGVFSEFVNRRNTDKTMAGKKDKRINNDPQNMHTILKIE
jgi:hypothetical protein